MKLKLTLLLTIFYLATNAQSKNDLSDEQKEYISKFIYPLKTFDPTEKDDSDLLILNKLIGDSKVIGLGESTHGSSEVYKMKYRISQYLISNKNFNVFSLEANMPESYLMNQYLGGQNNDPKGILKGMYFWLWQTEETLNFIEWLKNYNTSHNSKVYFDGFDMQYAKGALEQIKNIYKENNFPEEEIDLLETTLKEKNRGFRAYKKESQMLISEHLNPIKQKSQLISDLEKKARFLLNIKIIEQYIRLTFIRRDDFMAQNVKWMADHYPDSKVIVSAHNYHVSKLGTDRMGFWIKKDFADYINFGFAFYEGSYSASIDRKIGTYNSQIAYPGTLEYKLNSLKIPIFILDLKSIKRENNKLGKWILKDILFRKTGSGTEKNEFLKTNVADSFDYLIFINKSTHSKLLNDYSK
ncbi:hypothetical protein CEY12_20470 [Chryseobacterium sp. T16E-39]|uniref:erythromycin esterase family protein n=1 Tax=Chryseobacterium sp. T16E-39 TaxID=2015076 RepID=UPI000B5B3318|nr:erythromycin esterase family protein [Chryseobacterium sp. T16E-39]ASK32313.1 hypothetical protein CEY12_20470 [Chryseobacterium sp. T16E-39]